MLTLSCCWWVSTAAVPLLVWWFASKFLLSEKRKNSSSSRGNTSDPSTMTNNNHGINNNGNMIVNQTIFNNTMAHSNLLSSSTTTTTHSSSLSSWNEKSFLKKLVNVFSLFEKAISDDDLSKRISLSSANTLTSMESGQDHVKILHFKKCSLNIVMDTLQSNSMKQLIMDFYAKQQQESDETVVTTVHNGSSSNGETSTTRTDTKNTHPIPPFEGLEMSHLFNLDLYSSIDDSIRLELVSMILREDLSLVKGYLSAHVHMIEITHCKLTRIPIELLAQFPNLTSLNLSHNLIECIPEEFFVLASEKCPLKILNLSENKLRSIPNYFSTLFIKHKLLTLNVQENYIDLNTSIPTELKYITGRDKTHLSPNDDFTSPVNNFVKKNSPKARLSFSKVLTRKGSSHSHHHHETMRFICHMQRVPQLITDRLYLGSSSAATNLEELKRLGIDSVLCVNTITPFPDETERKKIFKNYFQISETDEEKTNIIQYFDTVIAWIDDCLDSDPKSNVLVHCSAGMSRSATLIIAYVMKKFDKNAEEAYQYVRERRCCIAPNTGFLTQIQLYQDIGKSFSGPMFEQYVFNQIFNNDKDHPSFVSLNYLKMVDFPPKFLLEKYELYQELEKEQLEDASIEGQLVQHMTEDTCTKKLSHQFSKLITLELQWNYIQNLESLVKFNLHEMVELDLSHNCIEQIPIELFTNLPQLRILNLSYNKIQSLPKSPIRDTKSETPLDTMVVTTHESTTESTTTDPHNENLNHRSVLPTESSSTVSPTVTIETNAERSTKLVDLRLGHNLIEQICEDNEEVFRVILKNLEMLDLSHNKLKCIPSYEKCFSHLQSLRVLSLYHNCFEREPEVIGQLRNMGKIVYYSAQTQNLREILKI